MTRTGQDSPSVFYPPILLPAIEELLAQGVDPSRIEDVFRCTLYELRTPFTRMPLLLARRFWELAVSTIDDPSIGLACGRRFTSTVTNGLTYLFDVAASLQSACTYLGEYSTFFTGCFRIEIVYLEHATELRFHDCASLLATPPITDYTLVSICSMVRRKLLASALDQDPIRSVHLAHLKPENIGEYDRAFRVPVHWNMPCHAIQLDSSLFSAQLTPDNHRLEQTLVELLQMVQTSSPPTLLEHLSNYVAAHMARGASLQGFCHEQHLLERTAIRRLKAVGWSFTEFLDDTRRFRAHDLLEHTELDLGDISDELGYLDVQSFNRACLRWFEQAPGVYRMRRGRG